MRQIIIAKERLFNYQLILFPFLNNRHVTQNNPEPPWEWASNERISFCHQQRTSPPLWTSQNNVGRSLQDFPEGLCRIRPQNQACQSSTIISWYETEIPSFLGSKVTKCRQKSVQKNWTDLWKDSYNILLNKFTLYGHSHYDIWLNLCLISKPVLI